MDYKKLSNLFTNYWEYSNIVVINSIRIDKECITGYTLLKTFIELYKECSINWRRDGYHKPIVQFLSFHSDCADCYPD